MDHKQLVVLIANNCPLPAGLTTTGNLYLGSYAHPLPAHLTTTVKNDLFAILDLSRDEIPALQEAIRRGRIDGSAYRGECRCLVGTLEHAGKGKLVLPHRPERLAERWFVPIHKGDTPETNQNARYAAEWIEEFLRRCDLERRAAQLH